MNAINIFKSCKLWDHFPTPEELREILDPGRDSIIIRLPAEKLKDYLDLCGFNISYNGAKKNTRYATELLYYIDKEENIITADLTKYQNIILE